MLQDRERCRYGGQSEQRDILQGANESTREKKARENADNQVISKGLKSDWIRRCASSRGHSHGKDMINGGNLGLLFFTY